MHTKFEDFSALVYPAACKKHRKKLQSTVSAPFLGAFFIVCKCPPMKDFLLSAFVCILSAFPRFFADNAKQRYTVLLTIIKRLCGFIAIGKPQKTLLPIIYTKWFMTHKPA